jgi:hypothetical protein
MPASAAYGPNYDLWCRGSGLPRERPLVRCGFATSLGKTIPPVPGPSPTPGRPGLRNMAVEHLRPRPGGPGALTCDKLLQATIQAAGSAAKSTAVVFKF